MSLHLLDALNSRLPMSMEGLLHQAVTASCCWQCPFCISCWWKPYISIETQRHWVGCRTDCLREVMRRLVGKCTCILTKEKATQFFNPCQYGVACSSGSERIVHKLRQVIKDNRNNWDFAILDDGALAATRDMLSRAPHSTCLYFELLGADFCTKTCLSPPIEKGSGILSKDKSRPADIPVQKLVSLMSTAFDIKVINPLNSQF